MTGGREKARLTALIVSIAFILIGGFRGELSTVFIKAVNICLECVGIG